MAKLDRIHELMGGLYQTVEAVDDAIEEVESMGDDVAVRQALEVLTMSRMALLAEQNRRKELPVAPKGYRRAFEGARRKQRRTAIGRGQNRDEALFLRSTKRAMQELQNRMLRRLRKTVS